MMDKKANECKRWKLRAHKAERKLKLISNILTQSQLEELQQQNAVPLCEDSSLQSEMSGDSSMESCQTVDRPHDSERHLARVTESKEHYKVSDENIKLMYCHNFSNN